MRLGRRALGSAVRVVPRDRIPWLKALFLTTLAAGPLVPAPLTAQQALTPKLRIGVTNLTEDALSFTTSYQPGSTSTTVQIPPPQDFALGMTEMLTTQLVETDRFVVLERTKIDAVLEEQDFGASGRVNVETAAEQGSVIGAQVLITGGITEFSHTSSTLGGNISVLRSVGVKADQVKAKVVLDLRVLDAVTGEVLLSERGEGEASARAVEGDVTVGEQDFSSAMSSSTPLGAASREAIQEVVDALVQRLSEIPWSGRIIDVRGDRVYVNAGSDDGIEAGMVFEVFEQQEALIDPATGRNLGAPEREVGTLRVVEVEEMYAVTEVTTGSGFDRNQVIRFVGEGRKP